MSTAILLATICAVAGLVVWGLWPGPTERRHHHQAARRARHRSHVHVLRHPSFYDQDAPS